MLHAGVAGVICGSFVAVTGPLCSRPACVLTVCWTLARAPEGDAYIQIEAMDLSGAAVADGDEEPEIVTTDLGGVAVTGGDSALEKKATKLLTKKLGRSPTPAEVAKKVKNLEKKAAADAKEIELTAKATRILKKKLGRDPTASELVKKVKKLKERQAESGEEPTGFN